MAYILIIARTKKLWKKAKKNPNSFLLVCACVFASAAAYAATFLFGNCVLPFYFPYGIRPYPALLIDSLLRLAGFWRATREKNDEFLSFCTCIRLLNPVEDTNRIEERYLVISTSSILFPTQIIGCFYPRPHTFLIDNFIYIFIIYSYSHAHVSMFLRTITIMTIINTRIHFVFCFLVGHRSVHIQMKTQAKTK